MNAQRTARLVLTGGLAYVFLSFGIDKFVHPILWIGWMPPWLENALGFSREQWLSVFGAVEILLGVLLLIPKRQVQTVAIALVILHLAGVITQTGLLTDTGVRDTGLLVSAMALFIMRK